MSDVQKPIVEIRPVIVRCEWGGWLAVSEKGSAIMIGTIGDTEEGARQAFEAELVEWARLYEMAALRKSEGSR